MGGRLEETIYILLEMRAERLGKLQQVVCYRDGTRLDNWKRGGRGGDSQLSYL